MEQTQTKEENLYETLLGRIEDAKERRIAGYMYTGTTVTEETIPEEVRKKLQKKGYPCRVEKFDNTVIYIWEFYRDE